MFCLQAKTTATNTTQTRKQKIKQTLEVLGQVTLTQVRPKPARAKTQNAQTTKQVLGEVGPFGPHLSPNLPSPNKRTNPPKKTQILARQQEHPISERRAVASLSASSLTYTPMRDGAISISPPKARWHPALGAWSFTQASPLSSDLCADAPSACARVPLAELPAMGKDLAALRALRLSVPRLEFKHRLWARQPETPTVLLGR